MKNYRIFYAVIITAFLFLPCLLFAGGKSEKPVSVKGRIILATTTSTQDSGLLDYILPVFTSQTGWAVDVVSVGTGAALQMGRDGQADVLLVHAKEQEIQFIADGHGLARHDVMYNDFVLVGPKKPIDHNNNITGTLKTIAEQNLPFVSRGDNSGTHIMEISLWQEAGINISALLKYSSVGQGMGAALQMAAEMNAYTLSDRATWLIQGDRRNMAIVCEKAAGLLNFYGVIAVNPAKSGKINAEGAEDFVNWILSPPVQKLIESYGVKEFGGSLFTPNAQAE